MIKSAPGEAAPVGPIKSNEKQKMLEPRRLSNPGFDGQSWEATLPSDTPIEEIASGQFWRLCSRRLNRDDHIHWRDESLTRFGELVVVGIDNRSGDIQVRLLSQKEEDAKHGADIGGPPSDIFSLGALAGLCLSERARALGPDNEIIATGRVFTRQSADC